MNMLALILATAAVFQQGTMGRSSHDFVPVQRTDNSDYLASLQQDLSGVTLREVSTQDPVAEKSLCYLAREGENETRIACQLRLARNNFNFNPFGLRFGKRSWGEPLRERNAGLTTSKLLPYLLYLRELRLSA